MVLHWGEWYDSGISLVLGIILLVLGGVPLLNQFTALSLSLGPLDSFVAQILLYVCALGGLWLLFDAFWGKEHGFMMWAGIIVGLVVLAVGLIPLLNQFGVIAWGLPVISMTVYHVLFVIEAVLLFVSAVHQ